MMEYLEKLMHDQEWKKALSYADDLLRNRNVTQRQLAIIYWALCNVRGELGDYAGSAVAGKIALTHAEKISLWDYYGKTCIELSVTYHRMGQYSEAETAVYNYLTHLPEYAAAVANFEPTAWFNAGTLHSTMGRHEEAARDYANGLAAATRLGMHRYAHGIRQALIEVYLRIRLFEPIPRLLAQCAHYLRHATSINQQQQSVFSLFQLRIEYALVTHRIKRARILALRALDESEGQHRHQYDFHMQLARMARQVGSNVEALGHSTAARILAAKCRRFDLESEATEFMYAIASTDPLSLERLDNFYLM